MRYLLRIFKIFLLAIIVIPFITSAEITPKKLPPDGLIIAPSDEVHGTARDSYTTLLNGAKNKIDLSMYQLKDQGMIEALIHAAKRGVKIRIITENNPYKHQYNQDKNSSGGIQQLEKIGITIKNLAAKFLANNPKAQAHYKILIVDDVYAVVMTGNWGVLSLTNTRDFALILSKNTNPLEFEEINYLFESDWNNEKTNHEYKASLIVGPDNQREKFIKLFFKAKQCIEIYQQSYNDEKIAEALEYLSNKGVKIKLLMMPFPFGGKKDSNAPFQNNLIKAGGEVKLGKTRYIHAKVVIIDGKMAYIGSCNFYPSSLDFNREVGVITQDINVINRLRGVFNKDWKIAEPKELLKEEL